LCHAVSPKTVPFESGAVAYKFTTTGSLPYAPSLPQFQIGSIVYGYVYNLGYAAATTINGFPVVDDTIPPYSDPLGASAFQELCQFMKNAVTGPSAKSSRMVASTVKTPFMNDVSAFALFTQAEGVGCTGSGGGIYGQYQLEVPILHPLLALVASGTDSSTPVFPTRNFNWAIPSAGDPCALGAIMSQLPTRQLSMKRNLRIKPVDFLEFGDVLAQWAQGILQQWAIKNAKQFTMAEALTAQCRITLQEMLLLLRSVIMAAFKESQAAIQGVLPFRPAATTDNEFVPFVASTNTCSYQAMDMLLPRPFIENILALTARSVKHPASDHDYQMYLPALGQYALDVLESSDYVVGYAASDGDVDIPVFKSGILFEKTEVSAKGEKVKTGLVEVAVSLVDGSSGSNFVFINDLKQLKALNVLWATWIKDFGLDTFSVTMGQFGTEKGINILASIAMTRVWIAASTFEVNRQKKLNRKPSRKEITVEDVRFRGSRMKSIVNTPYASRVAINDLSQGKVLSAPYEQVLQTWILPCDDDELIVGEESTIIQRWQFMMGEPWSVPIVSAASGESLSTMHGVYASKMVKGQFAEQSDWSELIAEMAKTGRGGILSGLIAGLVGNFVPALGGIAQSIADSLPI